MSRNVLIVDDSVFMRKIIERSLRQAQISIGQVLEARSVEEALQVLGRGNGIQLILLDVDMPGPDGMEFLRRLEAANRLKTVPVIVVTAEGMEARVKEALHLGAAGYVRKPLTPLQLQQVVARIS